MIGWPPLPVSDSGADRLYADGAGRRLRISHQLVEPPKFRGLPRLLFLVVAERRVEGV
jgi:hypothetical protein